MGCNYPKNMPCVNVCVLVECSSFFKGVSHISGNNTEDMTSVSIALCLPIILRPLCSVCMHKWSLQVSSKKLSKNVLITSVGWQYWDIAIWLNARSHDISILPPSIIHLHPPLSVGDCNNEVSFANNIVAFNCPLSINTALYGALGVYNYNKQ